MSAVSLPHTTNYPQGHAETFAEQNSEAEWARIATGATLLTGALLLLSGKRRPGLLVTAAGTALALLQEQDAVRAWWKAVPGYLNSAQHLLEEAQTTLDDLASKRDKLMSLFPRQG